MPTHRRKAGDTEYSVPPCIILSYPPKKTQKKPLSRAKEIGALLDKILLKDPVEHLKKYQ